MPRARLFRRVHKLNRAILTSHWEAGYAEGLGKMVIYTCKKGTETHFDTSHLQTVWWEADDPGKSLEELVSVIRVGLPAEAVLRWQGDVAGAD